MRLVRKAVIPAAGHGTRLLPLTLSQPKEMVACGPKPVIGYVLEELKAAGVQDVLLISRKGKSALEEYVYESWPGACVLRQPEQRGLGHAVCLAEPWTGSEPFLVALGDTIIQPAKGPPPLLRMVQQCPHGDASLVLVREVKPEQFRHYGIVEPAADVESERAFRLRGIIEKPPVEAAPSNLAIAGRYLFSPAIYKALAGTAPARGGEIQLTDAMQQLCGDRGSMYAARLLPGERRFDIGNFESYYEAFAVLSGGTGPESTP